VAAARKRGDVAVPAEDDIEHPVRSRRKEAHLPAHGDEPGHSWQVEAARIVAVGEHEHGRLRQRFPVRIEHAPSRCRAREIVYRGVEAGADPRPEPADERAA
jgi:hypothetical protein